MLARFAALFVALALVVSIPAAQGAEALLDLGPAGIPATMKAPANAKAAPNAIEVRVEAGPGFAVVLTKGAQDLAGYRREIAEGGLAKLRTWLVDHPDELVYESEVMGAREWHFVLNQKVGSQVIGCEDNKAVVFTKPQILAMVKACRSLKGR